MISSSVHADPASVAAGCREREITKLREEAKQALGARFDLRAFHDRVLEHAMVPLPLLRRYVEAWISGHQLARITRHAG